MKSEKFFINKKYLGVILRARKEWRDYSNRRVMPSLHTISVGEAAYGIVWPTLLRSSIFPTMSENDLIDVLFYGLINEELDITMGEWRQYFKEGLSHGFLNKVGIQKCFEIFGGDIAAIKKKSGEIVKYEENQ